MDFDEYASQLDISKEENEILENVKENGLILSTLDELWLIRGGFQEVIALVDLNEYASALISLDNVKVKCDAFANKWDKSGTPPPKIVVIISKELETKKQAIISATLEKWNKAFSFKEVMPSEKSFKKTVELTINLDNDTDEEFDYNSLLDAVEYIDNQEKKQNALKYHSRVDELLTFIDQNILKPILDLRVGSLSFSETDDNTLVLMDVDRQYDYKSPLLGVYGLETVTKELFFVLVFLQTKLEKKFFSIYQAIKRRSSTRFVSTLMGQTFTKVIPQNEMELAEFEESLGQSATKLQSALIEAGWLSKGSNELSKWAENLYHQWINCKKAIVFDNIRQHFIEMSQLEDLKLERVTDAEFSNSQQQQIEESSNMKSQQNNEETNDWDNWDDDEPSQPTEKPKQPEKEQATEEDGWDAWDDDDEPVITKEIVSKKASSGEDDEDWDAWGDDIEVTAVKKTFPKPKTQLQTAPQPAKPSVAKEEDNNLRKEALLCSISTIPGYLLSIISTFVNETHRFFKHHPQENSSNNRYESQVLENSISEILSLYRALSPFCYAKAPTPLIIYNDVVHLISRLRSIEIESDGQMTLFSFPNDNALLFSFADTQYHTAISEQQQKISKFLEKANRFYSCNRAENLFACQDAIERTVALFYEFSGFLEPYVSFPLRAKTLGTLLEDVASTLIKDIENLLDISAEESSELSQLIKAVQQLECLFEDPTTSSSPSGNKTKEEVAANAAALTSYYTASWIKMQYLEQILVSNLEQILYLYRNNLLVDFMPRELVELIQALFAASEQRQKTINTINSGR